MLSDFMSIGLVTIIIYLRVQMKCYSYFLYCLTECGENGYSGSRPLLKGLHEIYLSDLEIIWYRISPQKFMVKW
jgi:hypothetical protein